jgi:hypothetical protein
LVDQGRDWNFVNVGDYRTTGMREMIERNVRESNQS